MAEENKISSAISIAVSVLKNAFGENTDIESRKEFRYLQEKYLVEIYLNELENKSLSAFFGDIPSSIAKMRSTYLSTELVNQISLAFDEFLGESFSEDISIKESNENVFMRMLGMPQSDAISYATSEIKVINDLGIGSLYSYEEVEKEILNQRQLPKTDRKVLITYDVFNFDDTEEPISENQEFDNITDDELKKEISNYKKMNLANLDYQFFSYSYLLIPPVQDSRISKCINEPSKIVPPNFSNKRGHKINSNDLRTSMLETIIRIRKDRLSGYNTTPNIDLNGEETSLSSDDYGVLESLFILRIRCALKALAIKMSNDIDFLREVYEQTGLVPVSENQLTREKYASDDPRISPPSLESQNGAGDMAIDGFSDLEKQKIIEDSIMALLDDKSKALDLQVKTQRTSSIRDAHVMSSLLGIIDLPRDRIQTEMARENINRVNQINGVSDEAREVIDSILGISKGVGVIDVLVFVLALFTMPEDHLVGLLSDLEYQKYLEEFSDSKKSRSNRTPNGPVKIQTIEAVNMLTEYLISGYNLFLQDLRSDDSALSD